MPTMKTFSIGRAFGIPMYVDMSFFFIGILMLVGSGNPIVGIFIALGLGISIMAHEFGHSLMARKYGFRTRKITLSMIGGCAEMEAIPKVPSQEIMVAVAGPVINAILAIFNLLPGFPMDGGRVLRAWLSRKRSRQDATRIAMNVGRIFAVILACWGAFCVFSGNLGGVMSLLVSWFIWQAGWQEYMMSIYGG